MFPLVFGLSHARPEVVWGPLPWAASRAVAGSGRCVQAPGPTARRPLAQEGEPCVLLVKPSPGGLRSPCGSCGQKALQKAEGTAGPSVRSVLPWPLALPPNLVASYCHLK